MLQVRQVLQPHPYRVVFGVGLLQKGEEPLPCGPEVHHVGGFVGDRHGARLGEWVDHFLGEDDFGDFLHLQLHGSRKVGHHIAAV